MTTLTNLLMRDRKASHAAHRPPTVRDPSELESDGRYLAALQQLQQGAYAHAGRLFFLLQAEYPAAPQLPSLLAEARLKAELETTWAGKIKGRRPRRLNRRVVLSLLAYLVVMGGLAIGGFMIYRNVQSGNAEVIQHQRLLAQAQAALRRNDDETASQLFRQILSGDISNEVAQRGYREATWRLALASEYELGEQALQAHDFARAREYLMSVQQKAPSYRNVERLLAQVEAVAEAGQLLAAANTAFETQQWAAAVDGYEAVRRLDSTYAADLVTTRLVAAYLALGQSIVARQPAASVDLTQALGYFQKALHLAPGAPAIVQAEGELSAYLVGIRALEQANAAQAVIALEPLYRAQPAYLGGGLVERLYDAYLALGESAAQQADLLQALGYFEKAAALPVADASAARRQVAAFSATPTPLPTATRAAVYAPPPPPPPTATPAPPPATLADFKGWIAFRTNRDGGVAIYLMQPDGSQQQRAPNDAAATLDQLYAQQRWSADGATMLYVANAPDRADANLFLVHADRPESEARDAMLTDFRGDEYDPVWSPAGATIAFVANHTGNDEIWVMNLPDGAPAQLTHNEWEWDKHPTWSPDGAQIAFFSNRDGRRQIWLMDANGGNQRNISNSNSEDWDPVWIR